MTTDGRHVAIVTSGLGAGGAERVIALLAGYLVRRGDRVSVIAFDNPADRIYHPLPPAVRIQRLGSRRGLSSMQPLRRIVRLRRILAADRPDVLVSLLTKINAIALAATVGTGIPVIACERNNPERQDAHPAWNAALAFLYQRAAAIICQTRGSIRCLPRSMRARALVIPNPIVAYPSMGGQQPSSRLVAVGRLTRQKGYDLLIEAFARISSDHPSWSLDIWGDGEDRAALQDRIDRLGLGNRVTLRGLSATPGGWLEEASALVLSSRYEGFPNVLGEAMAAGLPVVATACDFGPAELIDHGRTGLLAAPDDIESLAAALDRLMADDALRARLGAAARAAMTRYAPDKILARWDIAFAEVCPRPRSALSPDCHLPAAPDRR